MSNKLTHAVLAGLDESKSAGGEGHLIRIVLNIILIILILVILIIIITILRSSDNEEEA